MKKYNFTDLTFVETAQALEDGKYVEWADTYPTPAKPKWRRKTSKNVDANFRYRLVEEVEEWVPEVGELVLVKNKDDSEWSRCAREYCTTVGGAFFCVHLNRTDILVKWDEIAPIKKEKREPRVIYVPKNGGGQYFISPDRSRVKFVEEI